MIPLSPMRIRKLISQLSSVQAERGSSYHRWVVARHLSQLKQQGV